MIFLTGDTHGWKNVLMRLVELEFTYGPLIEKHEENYLIVLGDFGVPWNCEDVGLRVLEEQVGQLNDFKLLFIAGNHENFDLLNQYPTMDWKGGKVSTISDNIYWLHTAEIFKIHNLTFGVYGGATSIDANMRTEGVNWWRDEAPSIKYEYRFLDNLNKFDFQVDCMLTHSAPQDIVPYFIPGSNCFKNPVSEFLQELINLGLDYTHWYFGHYHVNKTIASEQKTCLYERMVLL